MSGVSAPALMSSAYEMILLSQIASGSVNATREMMLVSVMSESAAGSSSMPPHFGHAFVPGYANARQIVHRSMGLPLSMISPL